VSAGVPRLSVVVAIEEGAANVPAVLAQLGPASHGDCEFLFCATHDTELTALPRGMAHVQAMICATGSRIPQMWRDGIVAARADCVALLSAQVVPARGWLDAVLAELPEGDVAGVGGYFSNDPQARPLDWAIYLLRYGAFSRPQSRDTDHIAADNAVYRRAPVLACRDLMELGFWEVEYHVRFRAQGLRLRLSDRIEGVHTNRYSAASFAAQRRQHGYAFGRDRARRFGTGRWLVQLLATPLLPALLAAKVLVRAARHGWLRRAPLATHAWLMWFVAHWCWGETRGLCADIFRRASWLQWPRSRRRSR